MGRAARSRRARGRSRHVVQALACGAAPVRALHFPQLRITVHLSMFDVLVYLYENYGAFEACPDATVLGRSLADAGFDDDEIREALAWLQGLAQIVQDTDLLPLERSRGTRFYAPAEIARLGTEAVGFLMYLDSANQLNAKQREIVVERALAITDSPLSIATMKIIVLMVLWSHSADVDFLLLEELLDDDEPHPMH
jgi:Smg protein